MVLSPTCPHDSHDNDSLVTLCNFEVSLIFRQIHSKFGHLGCLFHRNDAYLLPHTTPHEGQHGLHENLTHWTVVDGLMLDALKL